MASHHPPPELLEAFASGSLVLGQAMGVSVHLEYCVECRANVHRLKSLGGHLLASLTPQQDRDDEVKKRVFAQLDLPRDDNNRELQQHGTGSDIPYCLRKWVGEDYSAIKWRSRTPSIKSFTLCRDEYNGEVSLLKIMAGAKVGRHGHCGEELTLVLQGSFSDERGIYQQGDFILCNSEDRHNPLASKDAPCICFTVQYGPVQFTGALARMLNPFLRASYRFGSA